VISREELGMKKPELNQTYILTLTLPEILLTYRMIQEEK
jgi:hypothetical protein